jgi:pimeloyl-ACP methyl ester carboxylesterase
MTARPATTTIPAAGVRLEADVVTPADAAAVVLFAHGSGSSRRSPRNRQVAEVLHRHRLATVLLDLLTPGEERTDLAGGRLRFDVELLAGRLVGVLDQLGQWPETARLPVGLFGASTGAAAALTAAARRPETVGAVVSRGGRPDLAGAALAGVRAPTLLLVGSLDPEVVTLNEWARAALDTTVELRLVPGASHLFEEPGTLDRVAEDAAGWFTRHLTTV